MKSMKSYFLGCAIILFFTSCSPDSSEKNTVFVSILPQKYFVEMIAGDLLAVEVMVKPGLSPETYEPLPEQMIALSKANLYFAIGVQFEKVWLKKILSNSPNIKIIRTQQNIELIPHADRDDIFEIIRAEEIDKDKDYDKDNDSVNNLTLNLTLNPNLNYTLNHDTHHHGLLDAHIWLSPELVKIQLRNICDALIQFYPEKKEYFNMNLDSSITRISELQKDIRNNLGNLTQREFIVFHPSWGYFAREFNLTQIPLEVEGKDPSPAQLVAVIKFAKARGIKTIFMQKQFSSKSVETLAAEINGIVVQIDPLAYNYFDNLIYTSKVLGGN